MFWCRLAAISLKQTCFPVKQWKESFSSGNWNRTRNLLIEETDDVYFSFSMEDEIYLALFVSGFGILRKRVFYDFFFPIAIRKKDDLPKKLAICFSSIQSESLVRDLEMEEGKITIIKSMWYSIMARTPASLILALHIVPTGIIMHITR